MTDSSVSRKTWLYFQASVIGTLANFFSRFPLAEIMDFGASVVVANYVGMVLVFLLSYRRAFDAERADWGMIFRFATVAHIGLVVTWLFSLLARFSVFAMIPELFSATDASVLLTRFSLDSVSPLLDGAMVTRLADGFCHGCGIVAGFFFNYIGHCIYSFKK